MNIIGKDVLGLEFYNTRQLSREWRRQTKNKLVKRLGLDKITAKDVLFTVALIIVAGVIASLAFTIMAI